MLQSSFRIVCDKSARQPHFCDELISFVITLPRHFTEQQHRNRDRTFWRVTNKLLQVVPIVCRTITGQSSCTIRDKHRNGFLSSLPLHQRAPNHNASSLHPVSLLPQSFIPHTRPQTIRIDEVAARLGRLDWSTYSCHPCTALQVWPSCTHWPKRSSLQLPLSTTHNLRRWKWI